MKRLLRSLLPLLATLPFAACTDLSLPENPLVACGSDEDCPAGLVCRTQLERCIDPSLLDADVVAFDGPLALNRDVASRVPGFDDVVATFRLNRAPKAVTVQLDAERVGECASDEGDALAWTCSFTLDELPDTSEGTHGVIVIAEDELANRARAERAVRFDFSPPAVPDDTVWLRLRPGPLSAIRDISALGAGARAELQFVVTEALGPTAGVTARSGADEAAFTRNDDASVALAELHELSVEAGVLADGVYDLEVQVEDVVGNADTVVLAEPLVVDTTAPAAPDNAPDLLAIERAPWGTDDTSGTPTFTVTGAAGAVEAGAVVVIASGTGDQASELGRAPADDDGAVVVSLIAQDLARVYARAVDGAGNLGPPALVRGVTWRATLGRKVLGESFANPHAMFATGRLLDVLTPPGRTELAGAAATGGGAGQVEARGEGLWRQLPLDGTQPPEVMDTAAVYDRTRGRVLLFGGAGFPYQAPNQQFWEHRDGRWRSLDVQPLPASRRGHAFVWDARAGRAVLFGGRGSGASSRFGDTWTFDGDRWELIATEGPTARADAAMAWDRTRGSVILFGGVDENGTALADTWELVGDAWVQRAPAASPSARVGAAMAWDDASERMILFGGANALNDDAGTSFADTWAFDGSTWTDLSPATPPPARTDHALVADEGRGTLVLTGGRPTPCVTNFGACTDGLEDRHADTWEWTGSDWEQRVEGGLLEGIAFHASVYDATTKSLLVLQGWSGDLDLGGARATALHWEDGPRGFVARHEGGGLQLQQHATVFDLENEVFVAHGGSILGGAAAGNFPDVRHSLGGTQWTVETNTEPPAGRTDHAMLYVPGFGSVMLGAPGSAEPTWRWTGVSWRTLPGTTHPQRTNEAMAWDDARATIVLFGGSAGGTPSADTWLHNGNDWALTYPDTVPPARARHAMAWDDAREVVVLFGGSGQGSTPLADTWEWDGTDWADVTPASGGPGPLVNHELAWDPERRRVLLYGGDGESGKTSATWEWDGASWHELTTPVQPIERSQLGMAWDPIAARLAIFGGDDTSNVTAGDAWQLEPGSEARAAVLARFFFEAAGAPADVTPTGAVVRAVAGGLSTAADESGAAVGTPGASLRVWDGGRWRELASAAHAHDAPGALEATALDASQWLGGEGRPIHLAVTTPDTGGPTMADGTRPGVVVEYLELELTYELPEE